MPININHPNRPRVSTRLTPKTHTGPAPEGAVLVSLHKPKHRLNEGRRPATPIRALRPYQPKHRADVPRDARSMADMNQILRLFVGTSVTHPDGMALLSTEARAGLRLLTEPRNPGEF